MKPDLQRRVQRYGWDRAVEFYDHSWQQQLRPAQDELLKMASLHPGERTLDVASGTGLVTFRAAKTVAPEGEVTGTDISEGMIKKARLIARKKNIQNVSFIRMEAENLDLPDRSFNAALCSLGLMYVPNPLKALQEMYRILLPEGRAVVLVWGEQKNCGWAEIFSIVEKRVESDVCPLFFNSGTGNFLKKAFRQAKFINYLHSRISYKLHFKNDEEACLAAFAGGPVALAYRKFDERTRNEAHQEYLESIKKYGTKNGYEIPGEFVVVAGLKLGD